MLAFNHSPGGAIFDVNNIYRAKPSEEVLEIGRSMGRLDELMNINENGRLIKNPKKIYPACPQCFMVLPRNAGSDVCIDCEG